MVNQPIDPWEEDLWPVFDRLKRAMDKQEQHRVAGTLEQYVREARFLFSWLESLTFNCHMHNPVRTRWVYLTWKSSRGINQWIPDRDLPLRWWLAEIVPCPVPTAEAVQRIKDRHKRWAETDKANRKTVMDAHRAMERQRKKVLKEAEKAEGKAKKKGKAKHV